MDKAAPATIAVTGASGFIGAQLARRLLGSGYAVRVPARASADVPAGCEIVRGEFTAANVDALLHGATALIHCAGVVRGSSARHFDFNVDSTQMLAVAAARAAVPHRLLMSSLAAREPELSWYARSKRDAEAAVDGGWIVVRPTAVYGPGDRDLAPLFSFMAHNGFGFYPNNPGARLSFIHVNDLTLAIDHWLRCVLQKSSAAGPRAGPITSAAEVYELHDGTVNGYTWLELARIVETVAERKINIIPLPRSLLWAAGKTLELLAPVTGIEPVLSSAKVGELFHADWRCNSETFSARFDWQPELDLQAGLALLLQAK